MTAALEAGSAAGRSEQPARGSMSFVVFSDDWGEHPSSSQHLFRRVAPDHSVVWVNTIGMRGPRLTLTDLGKAMRKAGRMLRRTPAAASGTHGSVPPNIQVCQPFMLPYSGVGAVRSFNARSVARTVGRMLAGTGSRDRVLVSTVPNACDYAATLRDELVVYYCVDDFSAWPGHDATLVQGMERKLVERADVLLATSQKLHDMLSDAGKPVHLFSHGVDLEHFGAEIPVQHPSVAALPHPRAGYFGLIDDRTDMGLLVEVARRMPEMAFVMTGRVETAVEPLRALGNVHFTGPVPYAELPALVGGLDVLLLPYSVNAFGDTLSPLKLKEYLATGRPVVSTPIAEARRMREHVTIATGADEWVSALRHAVTADVQRRKRTIAAVLRGESWAEKSRQLLQICNCALERRRK